MKKIIFITLILFLVFSPLIFSQSTKFKNAPRERVVSFENHQRVKDTLVDMTVHCNLLEKQNARLLEAIEMLRALSNDLENIKDPNKELDTVLLKYGITRKKAK